VLGSVAEGAEASGPSDVLADWFDRLPAIAIGAALVALALAAYWLPGSERWYNHFVWQATAFLHGTAVIDWPVNLGGFPNGNDWMQDVYPLRELTGDPSTTGALLPFPPLPAIALMPFVAIWGLATDIRAVSVLAGAVDVALAWWALGRLPVSRTIRLATTIFFAFGTVFWYAAQLGTTWFFAHVVAIGFVFGALGVTLGSDPWADDEVEEPPSPAGAARDLLATLRRGVRAIDRRQLLAGVLFGIACTARLTVVFGAPFFLLVGGTSWARRGLSAGIGAAIPLVLLLSYNVATTGHLFHPGYEYQYRLEANGYQALGYNPDWDIEDARYLPQNLGIFLFSTPAIAPANSREFNTFGDVQLCQGATVERGLFDASCPIAAPRQIGMSIFLTSPAFLLAGFAFRRRSRLVAGSFLAVAVIAFVNLMHFSQGWVQFGYRFSNDFIVFALPLVALGMQRRCRVGWLGAGLIVASVAINLWGVIWGNILGW
jgi:hypothetical protein